MIVVFCEDPGAANYCIPLVQVMREQNVRVALFSAGAACQYLDDRDIKHQNIDFDRSALRLLESLHPSAVIVGTSENIETYAFDLVAAARTLSIPTIGCVDAQSNAEYRFQGRTGNPLYFAPEWLLVPDRATCSEYERLGHPGDCIFICGHPQFDVLRGIKQSFDARDKASLRREYFPNAGPDQFVLVFVSEVSTGLNSDQYLRNDDYSLIGQTGRLKRTEIVLEELILACNNCLKPVHLIVRLHPKNTVEEFADFEGEISQLSVGGTPYGLIYSCDLVVGMSSFLLSEALALGSPVLSVVPRQQEKEWLQAAKSGALTCVFKREDLQAVIRGVVDEQRSLLAGADCDSYSGPLDSAQRMLQAVKKVIGRLQIE